MFSYRVDVDDDDDVDVDVDGQQSVTFFVIIKSDTDYEFTLKTKNSDIINFFKNGAGYALAKVTYTIHSSDVDVFLGFLNLFIIIHAFDIDLDMDHPAIQKIHNVLGEDVSDIIEADDSFKYMVQSSPDYGSVAIRSASSYASGMDACPIKPNILGFNLTSNPDYISHYSKNELYYYDVQDGVILYDFPKGLDSVSTNPVQITQTVTFLGNIAV